METLRKILEQAETNGVAIGHFNISDLVTLKAVFEAARDLNVPVIVGASEGERQFMGVRQVAAMLKSLREEYDFPIFLNADHTHSLCPAPSKPRRLDSIGSCSMSRRCPSRKMSLKQKSRGRRDWRHWQRLRDPRCHARLAERTHEPPPKRNGSWKKPESIPWLLPLAICTECSRAWFEGSQEAIGH